MLHTLVGFENNDQFGSSSRFNFILSNGARTYQKDDGQKYYTHMMPVNSKIKSVDIYQDNSCIYGFQFFDLDHKSIFKIGGTA